MGTEGPKVLSPSSPLAFFAGGGGGGVADSGMRGWMHINKDPIDVLNLFLLLVFFRGGEGGRVVCCWPLRI